MKRLASLLQTLILGSFFLLQAQAQNTLSSGLVAYYPFNGNANDESGNVNNGAVYGATSVADRYGIPNSAYNFNGTGAYIEIPNAPANQLGPQFTISYWINPSPGYGTPAGGDCQIISKWGTGGIGQASYNLGITSDGHLYVATQDGTDPTTKATDTTVTPVGTWQHIVVVNDGTSFQLYRDDVLLFSTDSLVQPQPNSQLNLDFGREGYANYAFYGGGLDDIRFYNRALSSDEVETLYQIEAVPEPASVFLLGLSVVGLALMRSHRRQVAKSRST